MNVVHITTNDSGGAGSAVYRNHKLLLKSGIKSKVLVKNKTRDDVNIIRYNEPLITKIINRISSKFILPFLFIKEYFFFDVFYKKHNSRLRWLANNISHETDVVIVSWIATFIELSDLIELQKRYKFTVYINLVDMNLLTGGCHYSYGCSQYTQACLICPGASSTFAQQEIRDRFIRDSIAIDKLQAKVFAPIDFILNQAKSCSKPFYGYIKTEFPIDTTVFCFKPKKINENEKNVFIGAYNPNDHRKGYLTLSNALSLLNHKLKIEEKYINILVPNNVFFSNLIHSNIRLKAYNFASSEESLASLYQSSDLFVNTSIDDTGPAMPIEALMCGVPVICTKTGVAEEILYGNPDFGRLIEVYDSEQLANAIFDVLYSKSSSLVPSILIETRFKELFLTHESLVDNLKLEQYE